MNYKNLLIGVLLFGSLSGCANDNVSQREIAKLEKAINKWEAQKTQNYSYNFSKACFCYYFEEVTVVVRADTVHAILNIETGEDAVIELQEGEERLIDVYPELFYTIDEIFELLKTASLMADEMKGTYDSKIGYPTDAFIDYYENAIDDEVNYLLNGYENSN